MTLCLQRLRRAIDSLNQVVDLYKDKNNARIAITDVFEPMLQLLTQLLKSQRKWAAGSVNDCALK